MFKNKLTTGYESKPKKTTKKSIYVFKLFTKTSKSMSFGERFVKFLIYISLRLAIHPKKWKNPEKNYEIIDRTYKRIMSSDFIFIPSSIAFYLIMAFMPILSIIVLIYQLPGIHSFFIYENKDLVKETISKFIPGIGGILDEIVKLSKNQSASNNASFWASIFSLFLSIWIASNGFSKLIFTQSHIFEHKFVGGYWSNKAKGMVIVMLMSILLFLGLILNVAIQKSISSSNWSQDTKNSLNRFIMIIILFVGIFIGFTIFFKYSPRFKIKIRNILPGVMVSTIPTAGFLIIFGSITSLFSYGNYGTVGAIMYIGMGSLTFTYFIFVGIIANAAYYKTFVNQKVENKWTLSKK